MNDISALIKETQRGAALASGEETGRRPWLPSWPSPVGDHAGALT